MTKSKTRTITLRAMLARLNRHLANKGQIVKAPRGEHSDGFFVVDVRREEIVTTGLNVDRIVKMARELKLLQAWEVVR